MKIFRLVILCLIFSSCLHRESNEPYIESDFKGYTGIENGYKINKIIFRTNQSCIYLTLTDTEKLELKKRFYFTSHSEFSKKYNSGDRIPFQLYPFYKWDERFTYYIADGLAPHEYFIICLSKDNNEMIYCENFREGALSLF